jgi:hypothetical protein
MSRNSAAFTMENNNVTAPMPSASDSTADAVNTGAFHKRRKEYRRFTWEFSGLPSRRE